MSPAGFRMFKFIVIEFDIHSIECFISILVRVVYPCGNSILYLAIAQLSLGFELGELPDGFLGSKFALPMPVTVLLHHMRTFLALCSSLFQLLKSPNIDNSCTPGAHSLYRYVFSYPSISCNPNLL